MWDMGVATLADPIEAYHILTILIGRMNMQEKTCSRCEEVKPLVDFPKRNGSRRGVCKDCTRSSIKRSYEKNKNKYLSKKKEHYQENRKELLAKMREYRQANPDYNKKYYEEHRVEILAYKKKYAKENPDKIKEQRAKRRRSLEYRLKHNLRTRINKAIRRNSKSSKTFELIGCTVEQFKVHLANQFVEGMSWDNYGYGDDKWHIDHIKPCAKFNLKDPEQQKACFHYTNLQPLWQQDNLRKSASVPSTP